MRFADVERFLIPWLQARTPALVVVETPAEDDWPEDGTVIRVLRIGGPVTGRTLDLASVVIDVFAVERRTVIQTATDVRTLLLSQLVGSATVEGAVVSDVREASGLSWAHSDNDLVRRQTATYQITLH